MKERLLVVTVALLAVAGPALAHVEVTPTEAARGAETTFTFSVPNEKDNAKTVTVEIYLPDGVEHDSVSAAPPSGWQYVVTDSPGSVRFTGGTIAGADEVEFPITLTTPSSGADELVFKTVQTYDNGDVARWIEPTPPGGDEPEHPYAAVKLTGAASTTSAPKATQQTTAPAKNDDSSNGGPALVVGLLAVVAAGLRLATRRRRRST